VLPGLVIRGWGGSGAQIMDYQTKKKKYVKTNFDNNVTAYYVEVELHATSLSLSLDLSVCASLSLSAFFSECERDLPSFSSNEKLCLCQAPVLLPTLHATYQVPSGKI
jgi:hypothetical protein